MDEINVTPNTDPGATPEPGNNKLALAGFITSLAGLILFCCFPAGLVGMILGIIGLSQIGKDPRSKGKGFGIAGIIIGAFVILFQVLFAIAYFTLGLSEALGNI